MERVTPAIVDAHVHVWSDDRQTYPHVPGMARPMSHRGSADWLVSLMDASGVAGAVLVQTPWYGEDNRYLVEICQRYPGRFVAVGYLPDPLAGDAPEKLARQFYEEGLRGVRIHLLDARIVDGVTTGHADPLIRQARALGVPVQVLNRTPERHDVIVHLARRFPDVMFINDHLGHPHIEEGSPYPSSRMFFACGALPNVYAKVSLQHELSHEAYPWRDVHEFQRRTLDAYGPQRLMWGSNFPMQMPNPSYQARLDAVRVHLPFLTADDRRWILGGTACAVWPALARRNDP